MRPGIDEVANTCVQLFESERITYALMGGLAVRAHALPRATFDVDFTILFPPDDIARLNDLAERQGFVVPESQRGGWLDKVRGMPVVKFQMWIGDHSIDVDIFLAETAFQRELLSRRQRRQANGLEAWFVSPEDLILLTLLAGRPKDLVDVGDVLFIQGQLDEDYLRRWAKELDVSDSLELALRNREAF